MKKILFFLLMTIIIISCSKTETTSVVQTGTTTGQISGGEFKIALPKTHEDIYFTIDIAPHPNKVVLTGKYYSGYCKLEEMRLEKGKFNVKIPCYIYKDTLSFRVTGDASSYTAEYTYVE